MGPDHREPPYSGPPRSPRSPSTPLCSREGLGSWFRFPWRSREDHRNAEHREPRARSVRAEDARCSPRSASGRARHRNLLAYEEIAALKARLEEEKVYLQEEVRRKPRSARSSASPRSSASWRVVMAKTDSTVLVTGESGRERSWSSARSTI